MTVAGVYIVDTDDAPGAALMVNSRDDGAVTLGIRTARRANIHSSAAGPYPWSGVTRFGGAGQDICSVVLSHLT